jgi:hypothetical protein
MTTPEPRVRVRGNWMECDHCGNEYGYYSRMEANRQAHRHAAACPALRLARLIRELEALRDTWRAVGDAGLDAYGDSDYVRSWHWRADDLTALLARAAGGTG